MEPQECGGCFQGGEKGLGVKYPRRFSTARGRGGICTSPDRRMMNEGPQGTGRSKELPPPGSPGKQPSLCLPHSL